MPAFFVGHGSPMNALEHNRYTDSWRALGERVGRPRAILVVSAHWYIQATALTAMARPRTIHDFYGFPQELFALRYPAPGDPALAEEIADVVRPTWVGLDNDSWGIDHGAWSVLVHAFPGADVPVLQLAVNSAKSFDYHAELGAALAPLRQSGVLIIASGNVVHNLGLLDPSQPDAGFDWAHRFDGDVRELMATTPGEVVNMARHGDYATAAPTPEHFIPLLYVAGLAEASNSAATVEVEGFAFGSLSMTGYRVGAYGDREATPDSSG